MVRKNHVESAFMDLAYKRQVFGYIVFNMSLGTYFIIHHHFGVWIEYYILMMSDFMGLGLQSFSMLLTK